MKRIRKYRYANGGQLNSSQIQMGANLAGGFAAPLQNSDNVKTQTAGAFLSGAAEGASAGSAFGPWGAVVGGVIGGGAKGIEAMTNADLRASKMADLKRKEARQKASLNNASSSAVLKNYPTEGVKDATFYAMGGNIKGVMPLGKDTGLVMAGSHESGDDLHLGNGNMVEGDEVLHKDRVFSDRLISSTGLSFADEAEKISVRKGRFEKDLKSTDVVKSNTSRRMTENLDKKLNKLFEEQESLKVNNQVPTKEFAIGGLLGNEAHSYVYPNSVNNPDFNPNFTGTSGKNIFAPSVNLNAPEAPTSTFNTEDNSRNNTFSRKQYNNMFKTEEDKQKKKVNWDAGIQALGSLSPYIDNIANFYSTRNAKNVPMPILNRPVDLDTNYSINAPLAERRRQLRGIYDTIDRTTSNSSIGRSNKIAAFASSLPSLNALYNEKQNQEMSLDNNQRLINAQIDQGNVAQVNQYNDRKFLRGEELRLEKSRNIADATQDLQYQTSEYNLRKLDMEKFKISMKGYRDTGVVGANMLNDPTMKKAISDPAFAQEIYDGLVQSNRKEDADTFKAMLKKEYKINVK